MLFRSFHLVLGKSIKRRELVETINGLRRDGEDVENARKITEREEALRDFDSVAKGQISRFISLKAAETNNVPSSGYSSAQTLILRSNAVHACAYKNNLPYLQLVLNMWPSDRHLELLNSLDANGSTPLMLAASGGDR